MNMGFFLQKSNIKCLYGKGTRQHVFFVIYNTNTVSNADECDQICFYLQMSTFINDPKLFNRAAAATESELAESSKENKYWTWTRGNDFVTVTSTEKNKCCNIFFFERISVFDLSLYFRDEFLQVITS